jgi:hypothetical protein
MVRAAIRSARRGLGALAELRHSAVGRDFEHVSAGTRVGIALAGAVNLFDPEKVVLSGAYADLAVWLTSAMQAELSARVRIRPWDPAGLAVSALRREGPVVGAATSAVQRVIDDPSSPRT